MQPEVFHLDGEIFVRYGNETMRLTGPDLIAWRQYLIGGDDET